MRAPPLSLRGTITSGMFEAPTDARRATRRPRRDAAANRQRILAAATIAVRRDGERVPMATIADEAGVGIGTLYRHYPTRPALLAALTLRSFHLVLEHARTAALSDEPAPAALAQFFEQTIAARNEFILPFHGGPVIDDEQVVALRAEIRRLLEQVLARGRHDRTIRPDATPIDIIITGAMLAQPLPHAADWDELARRQARIFVAGLAASDRPLLRKDRPRE
jgi:AcrR family transcriptional regulator